MHRFLCHLQTAVLICLLASAGCTTAAGSQGTILFFGDSLTAAYGLDPSQGYPAHIEQKLKGAGKSWDVVVGAVSGDTSAGGLRRIDWMLQRKVDIFVLALGANDGLRGTDIYATHQNLQAIINRVKGKYPEAQLVIGGMMMPPSLGKAYTDAFAAIYPKLAKENNGVLIPFLLDGVAGNPNLNLPDGIHPTAEGQKILAENVWKVLEPLL